MTPATEPVNASLFLAVGGLFWLGGWTCAVLHRFQNRSRSGALSRGTVRYALRGQVVHRSFEEVERRLGYPVPQALRDFYAAPGFLHIERFEAPGLRRANIHEPTYITVEEFLPLIPLMLDDLELPDSTWLPFARAPEGEIYFLPLEEYQNGDGPIYHIDPGMGPQERERGKDIQRVADSLRSFLARGTRVTPARERLRHWR